MDGDVLEVVIKLVDYLGVNQTAERLGVSPEHLKEVVVGGAEFDVETIAIIDEVSRAIADAMDRAGITDEAISAAPELAPEEELGKDLESVEIRMPVLNGVGAEQSLRVDGSVSLASLDRLYELRLIALRRQRDMTLSDSEILEYKIMVTDYELQIIWDMGGTLPVQGGRWSQEHREQEAEKRLNELHRLRRERARADAGLRGLLRRLSGRHEQRRQRMEDGLIRERTFLDYLLGERHRANGTGNGHGEPDSQGNGGQVDQGTLPNIWHNDEQSAASGAD